jgi:DNA-binding PadR family transcriptional regulator
MDEVEVSRQEAAGERIPRSVTEALRAHPRFAEAARRAARASAELYRTNALMFRAMRDTSRWVCAVWALYLDATEGGLTHARLRDLCVEAKLLSPGTAYAVLIQLRVIGYVEMLPYAVDDGRVRVYRPTARMLEAFRRRMRHDVEGAAMLDPSVTAALDRWDEPQVFQALIRRLGEGIRASARVHDADRPSLHLFAGRTAGMPALYNLLSLAEPDDDFPPRRPLAINLAELSRRCSVSRTHMLRLLRDVEATGFLAPGPHPGESVMTDFLREEVELFYAIYFAGLIISAREATGDPAPIADAPPWDAWMRAFSRGEASRLVRLRS